MNTERKDLAVLESADSLEVESANASAIVTEPTDGSADRHAERLEQEIEQIRENLGGLVSELGQRRHRLNPVSIIVRNPWPIAIGGAVLVVVIMGGVVIRQTRSRRKRTWTGRSQALIDQGKRLRQALDRAMDRPDKPAKADPGLGMKILAAAATTATAIAVRRIATQLFAHPK